MDSLQSTNQLPNKVHDLLSNFKQYSFKVSKEAPVRPSGGSLYLFNRRVVRFFRKDGHNWRKKADGKTVRETHEKLKIGNRDVLNCYYAHAEDGTALQSLQRRCYWLLDGDGDVVLVHYLMAGHGSRVRTSSGPLALKKQGLQGPFAGPFPMILPMPALPLGAPGFRPPFGLPPHLVSQLMRQPQPVPQQDPAQQQHRPLATPQHQEQQQQAQQQQGPPHLGQSGPTPAGREAPAPVLPHSQPGVPPSAAQVMPGAGRGEAAGGLMAKQQQQQQQQQQDCAQPQHQQQQAAPPQQHAHLQQSSHQQQETQHHAALQQARQCTLASPGAPLGSPLGQLPLSSLPLLEAGNGSMGPSLRQQSQSLPQPAMMAGGYLHNQVFAMQLQGAGATLKAHQLPNPFALPHRSEAALHI